MDKRVVLVIDGLAREAILKGLPDAPVDYFTKDEMTSTADGTAGADKVGATEIVGLVGSTVQALLAALKSFVDSTLHQTTGHKHTGVAGDGPIIVESGSNANGNYEKRSDGAMECWGIKTGISYPGGAGGGVTVSVTFPLPFIDGDVVCHGTASVENRMTNTTAVSDTGASLDARNTYASIAAVSGSMYWRAIGRWK